MECYHADHTPKDNSLFLKRIRDCHCVWRDCGAQSMAPHLQASTKAWEAGRRTTGMDMIALRRAGPQGSVLRQDLGEHRLQDAIPKFPTEACSPRADGDRDAGDARVAYGDPPRNTTSAPRRPSVPTAPDEPSPDASNNHVRNHPALPFPSDLETFHIAVAISRGEKGPNLALGPNLLKELIFKAILSQLHCRKNFDLWVAATAELLWYGRGGKALGGWGQF